VHKSIKQQQQEPVRVQRREKKFNFTQYLRIAVLQLGDWDSINPYKNSIYHFSFKIYYSHEFCGMENDRISCYQFKSLILSSSIVKKAPAIII
jgi:hypothetical protein